GGPGALDDRGGFSTAHGRAEVRDRYAGVSEGGPVRVLRRLAGVQCPVGCEGRVARGARGGEDRGGPVDLLPGRRDRRHLSGHDDRDPGEALGSLRAHESRPTGTRPEGVGGPSRSGQVEEASPWSEETHAAPPAESARDSCGDGADLGQAAGGVKMTPSKGWAWRAVVGLPGLAGAVESLSDMVT